MDSYDELLIKAKKTELQEKQAIKKMNRTIISSKWKLILTTLTVALLIVPTSYMLTFIYYAFGTKSTVLMDVVSQTLYITEPNTTLEELEFDMDFSPFSMDLSFEQYKQIGDEFYPAKTYDLQFTLNDLTKKEVHSHLEKIYPKYPTETNQWLAHPKNTVKFNSSREWKILEGLPDETVVEAYISLIDLYTVDEVANAMPNVDITWAAIFTGVEENNLSASGNVVSPIGYPVQRDSTNWSPFKDAISHEDTFLTILKNIQPYEEIATTVSSAKNLKLAERIQYVEENGFKTYGVVITGSKNAILSLENSSIIQHMKLGEVKLWNLAR